jgi:RNA polymerase sigma-70 factor (ECF subfamily)
MTKEVNIQRLAESFIESKSERNFQLLFERLKPGLTNHCYGILKDTELAQDSFLNTMSKIWQKIEQYDCERGNFSTWCYNIARNESLLLLKSRKRYVSTDDDTLDSIHNSQENMQASENEYYDLFEDPSLTFLNGQNRVDELYESIIQEIRDLPELYKDIMIDREINGMKYKDIATKYDIKKRSIATRIRRARNKIRKKVESLKPDK